MNPGLVVVDVLAGLVVLFALFYLLARRIDNFGIVDIVWSYAFAGTALYYAACGPGWPIRRALIAAITAVWSLRLGTYLLVRIVRHHPEEDTRYQELRREWGSRFPVRMAGFFQLQAASVVFLSAPFFLASQNGAPALSPWEIAGTALWLLAISGEACADAQLAAFRRNPSHRGQVCDRGLWHYSRHPNYFCEWLIWVAYFIFACGSPWGWLAVVSPACILALLLRVTGIPMTEAQSIRSKGDAYRRYQKTTNAFVPWAPKVDR